MGLKPTDKVIIYVERNGWIENIINEFRNYIETSTNSIIIFVNEIKGAEDQVLFDDYKFKSVIIKISEEDYKELKRRRDGNGNG